MISFKERIYFLLGSRKINPWVTDGLKLKSATADAINAGNTPKMDVFWSAVRRLENVREEWLRTGEGAPFYAEKGLSDDQMARCLELCVEDDALNVTLVESESGKTALVFWAHAQMQAPKQTAAMPYFILEIHGGTIGPRTHNLLIRLATAHIPDVLRGMRDETFERMVGGQIGAYEMCGDPNIADSIGGLMAEIKELEPCDLPMIDHKAPGLDAESIELLRCFNQLNSAQRAALLQLLKAWEN